jgi:hypothetical protein
VDPVSSPPPAADSQALERELQVQQVVGALKSLADLTDASRDRRAVVERVGARLLAAGVRKTKDDATTTKVAGPAPRTPVALAAYCEKHLGPDWTHYEPETLIDRLAIDERSLTALLAAKLALHRAAPFTAWEAFAWVAQAFNGHAVTPDVMPELLPAELAWAADELRLIDPVTPWGDEVAAFVAVSLHQDGLVQAPPALRFAQTALDSLLSDHGRAVQHAMTQRPLTPEATLQHDRLAAAAAYVKTRHDQALQELEAL